MIPTYEVFDYLTHRGENALQRWIRDDGITKRDRARLNQKLDRLVQMDYWLAVRTSLLTGPIHEHIYKLVVHGEVMLRPLLCRGPKRVDREYTLLIGAVETGDQLPAGVEAKASERRLEVLKDPEYRRTPHERFQ